jgi:hypothetical protein
MIGITHDDLIQHALECLYANEPPIEIAIESIWKYCVKRIDHRVRAACAREENRPQTARFVPLAHTDADEEETDIRDNNVIPLSEYSAPDVIFESAETVRHFLNILEQNRPHLVQLFHLQISQDTDPSDESRQLGLSVTEVYRLRKELADAKRRFFQIHVKNLGD